MYHDRIRAFVMALLVAAALAPGALARTSGHVSARTSRPVIKGEEVGYFGGAATTTRVSVFVYSNLGPNAGNRVTVCMKGRCERAQGHNAVTSWYSAPFRTRALRMGDAVTFEVVASDAAGQARATVTKGLLCMHNNGSTPQA